MTTVAGEQRGRVRAFLRLVMIEHSVFALPFAYLGALVAMATKVPGTGLRGTNWWVLLLVTVAMVAGRTFAMAVNRIIDRKIDAGNPRTAGRELVTGAVSVRTAWTGAGVALVFFVGAAALLNPLCLVLSPLAVAPMVVYPYGKRFTNFPHAILAIAQAAAPTGAWLAVTGSLRGSLAGWVLGGAVGLWIGGFDLIYACQDVAADRRLGVHSFPARYGVRAALVASSLVHVVTFALFVAFGALVGAGWAWWLGLLVVAAALGYEHAVVRPDDLSKVNRAFFTMNGFIAIALFLFALLDLVLR